MNEMSLTDQIRNSTTTVHIDALLREGEDYSDASTQTRKKWLKTATTRRTELRKTK